VSAPDRGLLTGVRVIESSLLGPGELTSFLADLGADVIKVEPPQGDYIRRMTWPIVEGDSLLHLHIHRGKRSVTLDLRTPRGCGVPRPGARRRRRRRGDAPGCPRQTGPRVRPAPRGEPAHRVLLDLGLRATAPTATCPPTGSPSTPGPASSRPPTTRTGSATCPSIPRWASTPDRSSGRWPSWPGSPRPRDRRRRRDGARPIRRRATWTGTGSRPGAPTSDPSPRSPATPATTTSGAPPAPPG